MGEKLFIGFIIMLGIICIAGMIVNDATCEYGHNETRPIKGVMMNHFVCDKRY